MEIKNLIEKAWDDRSLLSDTFTCQAIECVIEKLDKGELRIAYKINNNWIINEWVKKAVVLYFPIRKIETFKCIQ